MRTADRTFELFEILFTYEKHLPAVVLFLLAKSFVKVLYVT